MMDECSGRKKDD